MGYTVDVKQTSANTLKAGDKNTIEVSLVKKGARDGCHILAFQDHNATTRIRNHGNITNNCTAQTCHSSQEVRNPCAFNFEGFM